jgi:hypothetical protein
VAVASGASLALFLARGYPDLWLPTLLGLATVLALAAQPTELRRCREGRFVLRLMVGATGFEPATS